MTPEHSDLLRKLQRDSFSYSVHQPKPINGLAWAVPHVVFCATAERPPLRHLARPNSGLSDAWHREGSPSTTSNDEARSKSESLARRSKFPAYNRDRVFAGRSMNEPKALPKHNLSRCYSLAIGPQSAKKSQLRSEERVTMENYGLVAGIQSGDRASACGRSRCVGPCRCHLVLTSFMKGWR